MLQWEELEWQKYAEECKGMIVTNPGTVCSAACTFKDWTTSSLGLNVSQKQ